MKAKKLVALLLGFTTLAGTTLATTACGNGIEQDGKTIYVMMNEAGYGTAWFEKIEEAYEELYSEEGYQIEVYDVQTTFQGQSALNDMRADYEDSGIDLFITAGVYVNKALDLDNEAFGPCVADLTESVYSQPAINFDGTTDEVAIKELEATKRYKKYLVNPESPDDYYRFQYFAAPTGIAVNMRVLGNYGFTEFPRTSNEMFEIYDAIYEANKDLPVEQRVFPVTWAGANAFGYSYNGFLNNLASMLGHDAYDDFFTLNHLDNEAGYAADAGENYYKSVETEIKECLEVFAKTYDLCYSVRSSSSQKHDLAHAQAVKGQAAFMKDGSYFYNEVKTHFATELHDMRFMPMPMVSEFGVMLKLDGTGNDAEKCDEILSFLCKTYDEMETTTEEAEKAAMKAAAEAQFPGITFTNEQIDAVWEARGTVSMNLQADAYIAKDSPVKDQAALLLRMMASEDAAEVQQEYCMPHSYHPIETESKKYQWITDSNKLGTRINKPIFYSFQEGMRVDMNLSPIKEGASLVNILVTYQPLVQDVTTRDYEDVASKLFNNTLDLVKGDKWTNLLRNAYRVQ